MKPNIIIVGPSGSGKSSSMRNLDPKSTAVINTERKQLPFKNANDFMNVPVKSVSEFHSALDKAMESDKIKTIVIESFTSLIEIIYREAEIRYKGFDIWGYYNKEIGRILDKSKNSDKYVVFTAIDGVYDGDNGVEERFVAIDGNRWKKRVCS
jgi:septin family protein